MEQSLHNAFICIISYAKSWAILGWELFPEKFWIKFLDGNVLELSSVNIFIGFSQIIEIMLYPVKRKLGMHVCYSFLWWKTVNIFMNWKRVFASVMVSILYGQYFKRPKQDTQQPSALCWWHCDVGHQQPRVTKTVKKKFWLIQKGVWTYMPKLGPQPKSYQFFKRDLLDKVLIFGSKTISLRHLIVRTPRTQGSSAVHGSILG